MVLQQVEPIFSFLFCYKVFTEGFENFTGMLALHDPTSTCMWSDNCDILGGGSFGLLICTGPAHVQV